MPPPCGVTVIPDMNTSLEECYRAGQRPVGLVIMSVAETTRMREE